MASNKIWSEKLQLKTINCIRRVVDNLIYTKLRAVHYIDENTDSVWFAFSRFTFLGYSLGA